MNKLEIVAKEFRKYREWGNSNPKAAKNAVNIAFEGILHHPHIHKDAYGDASHIFFDNQVLFFDGGIYQVVK